MWSEALRSAAPSTKYQCVEAAEAHGWLAGPSGVEMTWLTLAMPPYMVTRAPTHGLGALRGTPKNCSTTVLVEPAGTVTLIFLK
jgi:hypothetical protein